MSSGLEQNSGSFRDPTNQVYELKQHLDSSNNTRILRGINSDTLVCIEKLFSEPFYQKLVNEGLLVDTRIVDSINDPDAKAIKLDGWTGVLDHEVIPFVSYPYEWSFAMLKDAALLHLSILENCLEHGWILKDSSPYNIQWVGTSPVFIDTPSFIPWTEGEPWVGYRQFCSMFFTPLAIRAHLGIDHIPILRSNLDGVTPTEAINYFSGLNRFKKGVLSHIVLPSRVEKHINDKERDDAPAHQRKSIKQSKAMVLGLVQSMSRLISKLSITDEHTDWSQYDKTHSYTDIDHENKKEFILKHLSASNPDYAWDIGCNTGTFSKLCSEFCNYVIAIDGDHGAVDKLYLSEKGRKESNIHPLVMNLSNISPSQGWASTERLAFDCRKKPDLVLCLALIHHVRITSNIPNILFLKWLHTLKANVILEFVNRDDEMVKKLLTNKAEQYEDYNISQFVSEIDAYFNIEDRQTLKEGKRELFMLTPK